MRLTLRTDPHATQALSATRQAVRAHANRLLVAARQHPDHPAEALARTLGGPPLPACVQRDVAGEVERARHWSRGGLKTESYWLGPPELQLNLTSGLATVWTLGGPLTLPTRLGNYQRHLLERAELSGGRVTLSRAGEWYLNLHLAGAPGPVHAGADVDELERQGQFAEVLRRLPAPSGPRAQGQRALALLETGATDQAELALLTALGTPQPDARVHLGLSLLAGSRREPHARLRHADQGLEAAPDDFTRWWLQCSQARALVELGQAGAAQPIIEATLEAIPAGELRSRARALYFAQGVAAALDDFGAQDRYAREALRLFELLGINGEGLSLRLDLAYRLYFQGRADECFAMIAEVLRLTERLGDPRAGAAHLICAELHLLGEQFAQALEHLEHLSGAQHRHASDRLDLPARAFSAECLWRLGRLPWPDFERRIESLRPTQDFDHVVKAFYTGLLAFEAQQTEQACAAFEQVTGGVALLDGFRLRSYAFLAHQRWVNGAPLEEASADLLRALNHVGGELALGIDASRLAPLYTECARHGIGGRPVQRLAQRQRPTLAVRALGGFQASVNGQALHIRLSKARELLAYLALHGPCGRDTLITALWDGSARGALGSYFKQALHALREALRPFMPPGADPVPHVGGLYQVADRFAVQCDARLVRDSHLLQGAAPRQEALAAYAGPFLPEVDTEWAQALRADLEVQAQLLAMTLGREQQRTDLLGAARTYLLATRINPLFESAWTAAALAYEQAGQPHLARQTERQYARALQLELGEPGSR